MRRVPAKINAELFSNAKKVKIFNTELSHKKTFPRPKRRERFSPKETLQKSRALLYLRRRRAATSDNAPKPASIANADGSGTLGVLTNFIVEST